MAARFLLGLLTPFQVSMLGALIACIGTFLLLNKRFDFLPRDHGREFAINGELSKGKLRGVGLIITVWFIVTALIFINISLEFILFLVLLFAVMLSGYLDDASEVPWKDYKKGLIDLIICIAYMATFIGYNATDIMIYHMRFHLHPILYFVLGIVLIWASINVTNCSDCVDALCGSLSFVTIVAYGLLFTNVLGEYFPAALIMAGCILAYLYFNSNPSSMLMGDAGSRTFGFFIAVLAMKSQHPLSFLVLALVMIIDGGLGLIKLSMLRFLKIKILAHTRTPIHDELRKNRNWSDTQVVNRFVIFQLVFVILYCIF